MPTATETAYETLGYDVADHVCTITLNRPDVYNAFNDQMKKDLDAATKAAARDRNVRVVILTGAGKAYGSGQDLADLKTKYVPGHVPMLGDDLRKTYYPFLKRLVNMPKPVIGAINGVAAGAGCSLALACDMRIASEHASFIEVFINVGLIPDSGSTWTLPRLVGLGKAMELCMTGDKVGAEEALRLGLVNKVVPADDLMAEANKLAKRLVSLPARGIALTKKLLLESSTNSFESQLDAEAYAQETAGQTEDHFEGVMAFLEKRKPEFKGK